MSERCRGLRKAAAALLAAAALACPAKQATAARIKDIAQIQGVRENQLVGYGLVLGLEGTGDGKKSIFTVRSLANMLEKMGISVGAGDISVKNVAAVMVTAKMPPFARTGSRIDVTVSSIGDAKTLQGGTLLLTPLKGADGRVYAVAQGAVSTGGFQVSGAGAGVQKNFPTVGRVVGGGLVEREVPNGFRDKRSLSLVLHRPDFTTASRVTRTINAAFARPVARTLDAGTIEMDVTGGNPVQMVTRVESLDVTPDRAAKVVVNERTGTVVMGDDVRISTVAVAHGNLSIQIKESARVSQPAPFSKGKTVVTPDSQVSVQEDNNRLLLVRPGVSIGDLVRALNALGVSPRDLIAIFQAIKAAGALEAELEII